MIHDRARGKSRVRSRRRSSRSARRRLGLGRGGFAARALAALVVAAMLGPVTPAHAGVDRVVDFLVPGRAQAREGRIGRAVILGGAAVASASGLVVSTINYDRAVEEYEDARTRYADLGRALARGDVVSYSEITSTWSELERALDRSDSRYTTRRIFVGLVAAVYVANAVDILLAKPVSDDEGVARASDPRWGIDVRGERVGVYRAFRF